MIAVDTNIVLRYLVNDDAEQARRARTLVSEFRVYLSKTVLLETAWVLKSGYKLPRDEVIALLQSFCGLEAVIVESASEVTAAFGWMAAGVDFADAMHLASGQAAESFASFDKDFIDAAETIGLVIHRP